MFKFALKHEKGKIFRKIRIFYSIEFFIVIIGNVASPITLFWLHEEHLLQETLAAILLLLFFFI